MKIELSGGTTNRLLYDPQEKIVDKYFLEGNGIGRPMFDRVIAEVRSMHTISFAPDVYDFTSSSLTMSYVEGENHLDQHVGVLPEVLKEQVYVEAGKRLREAHVIWHSPLSPLYHEQHRKTVYELLAKTSPALTQQGVSPINLLCFLEDAYNTRLVESEGFVWVHGDYWLSNIIGKEKEGVFQTVGVVDWELAGLTTPYEDFGVIKISVEGSHPESSEPFWKGYGRRPDTNLQMHYALAKVLEWMTYDDPATNGNYSSDFYQNSFAMMKGVL